MRVLVVDIGNTNVKILATGEKVARKAPSGRAMTPAVMVEEVKALADNWEYDAVAIGYPGHVREGRILVEPHNLGLGWVEFDFEAAFKRPVRVMNDAAMQALGSHQSGLLLFLGLGTGLGAALVAAGVVIPLELAHLSYKRRTYDSYLGARALRKLGRKKWQKHVEAGVAGLIEALHPDDVVLGGSNAKKLKTLPPGCRAGTSESAFLGGFRLWEDASEARPAAKPRRSKKRAKPAPRSAA